MVSHAEEVPLPSPSNEKGLAGIELLSSLAANYNAKPSNDDDKGQVSTFEIQDPSVEQKYLTGINLYIVMFSMLIAVYMCALDQTIIGPAIPIVSNDFRSLADVGWYGSVYFATSTALQPLYGRMYRLNLKWPFFSCITIFETGSLICALAHNSSTFIVGRAIAGIGVAGGYIGVLTIVAASVPQNKVPLWSGAVGAIFGVGSITGPLLGGVFTSKVSWRWCFWINLPVGGLVLLGVFIFFHPPARPAPQQSLLKTILKLDWTGTALVVGALICYLLALQDGGLTYPWSSAREIGLLVGAGAILPVFLINEWIMKDDAILPLRVIFSRTIGFASLVNLGVGASYFAYCILLPIYFQLTGSSSIRSGVQMLPAVCGAILAVSLAGASAAIIGFVQPMLFFGSVCGAVGAGLAQLYTETTSMPLWILTSFLFGIGAGATFQMPFVISQTFGKGQTTEMGSSCVIFFQTLGGTLAIAACQSIYANYFKKYVLALASTGINAPAIIASGTTGFRSLVSPDLLPAVVNASVEAIRKAFIPTSAFMGLALIATIPLPWVSVKGQMPGASGD